MIIGDEEDVTINKTEKKFFQKFPGLGLLYKKRIREENEDISKKFMSSLTLMVYILSLLFTCKILFSLNIFEFSVLLYNLFSYCLSHT